MFEGRAMKRQRTGPMALPWARTVTRRLTLIAVTIAAALPSAGDARAEPGDACVSSYEGAQEQRRASDPLRERAELRLCLGACPAELARDCTRWLAEIEPKIGHLVMRATNVDAAALQVDVDGTRQTSLEVEVNPGEHRVRLAAHGFLPLDRTVTVTEGATVRVEGALTPEPVPPPRDPAGPGTAPRLLVEEAWAPSTPGFILGGIGVSAMAVALGLTIDGHLSASNLREACAPNCTEAQVAPIKNEWTAAGIVGGVGLAALVTGVTLVATHREERMVPATTTGIAVTPSGASVFGTF